MKYQVKTPTRKIVQKKAIYTLVAAIYAVGFAFLTFWIYSMTDSNILLTAILNLSIILAFTIAEKFEKIVLYRLEKRLLEKGKINWFYKIIRAYFGGPSMKTAFYFYYFAVLVGLVILRANPYSEAMQPFVNYLAAMQYGVLFLIASDKFLDQIIKDIKRDDQVIHDAHVDLENEHVEAMHKLEEEIDGSDTGTFD